MGKYAPERPPVPTPLSLKEDLRLQRPPFWMIGGLVVLTVASWVPLVMIALKRATLSDKPKVHLIQDMDNQPRFKAQAASPIFVDGRAMRPPVTGTIARGMLEEDDHYYRGFRVAAGDKPEELKAEFFKGYPAQVTVDEKFMARGQKVFGIYCAQCHGLDGYGNGTINQRATELQDSAWVPPANLHADTVRAREEGHIYNTIRNGIRNMPGYGAQIETADRWAVVAYVRALQLSQHAAVSDVPPDQVSKIR